MKQYKNILLFIFTGFLLSSCDDLLDVHIPGDADLEGYFTDITVGELAVNAAYVPMTWQYNRTYYPEWFIGDIVSDDALKGGQSVVTDMRMIYDMENFLTQSDNEYLNEYYNAQYEGIFRANFALEQIEDIPVETDEEMKFKERILGEAYFLRAFYYLRLVRVFGGVPKVDEVIKSQYGWRVPRASAEEIYDFIIEDLKTAYSRVPLRNEYTDEDLGRVTKGAAAALLMKTYLNIHDYTNAKAWGDSVINSNQYSLCPNYADNFTLEGENGPESVFEIQYEEDGTSDYGDSYLGGNGFTAGNFTVIMTRARPGGWGFNRPTKELYNEFEVYDDIPDPRREVTIYDAIVEGTDNPEIFYLGDTYHNRKYAMMNEDDSYTWTGHATRAPINKKEIRYADVLLMYAEACCETGNLDRAKWALEEVRNRARGGNSSILPSFPYGNYRDTKDDLVSAIRHERRVELAMEGNRWFDLVRWGVAAEVMNAYRDNTSEEVRQYMRPFEKGKHELFPIPLKEIERNPMPQNPGY
ncbi:MAG: RagB/SusD family nutrient uptake outer membrane protein [Candidatus Azobacteroides sp.]|nr:RagB/SusD family nutrient uptake outer membrane protein [Candidatus Azobacteroides sp.]